jgi:hypothetical protein
MLGHHPEEAFSPDSELDSVNTVASHRAVSKGMHRQVDLDSTAASNG